MPRTPDAQPSEKQLAVLRYLVAHVSKRGYQPSQEEMAKHFSVTKTAIASRLRGLERHRLVRLPSDGRERAVVLVGVRFTPQGGFTGE